MPAHPSVPPLQGAGLCQIGLVVRNADLTAGKLARLTGITPSAPIITDDYEKARTQFRGNPTRAKAKLIFFDFGQVSIEIIEPIGGPSTWSEFLEAHGDGVHHIAFSVKSTKETAESLAESGIPLIQSGVFEGGSYKYEDSEKELSVILELLDKTSG